MPRRRCACGPDGWCVSCQALAVRAGLVTVPVPPAAMPESALLRAVRQAALDGGYLFYHTRRSDGSDKGWPDTAICKPGRPLYLAELKSATGKLTVEQSRWMTTLAQCTGVVSAVWRPADVPRILALLQGDAL